MSQLANDTGLSREQLYRSFSEHGNPTLKTVLAVLDALDIDLNAHARNARP
jgi:probable addiction module antidote protein